MRVCLWGCVGGLVCVWVCGGVSVWGGGGVHGYMHLNFKCVCVCETYMEQVSYDTE